jgi:hypothetical protein
VLDVAVVEDALVRGAIHRPGERREPAVAEAVDRREVGVGDGTFGSVAAFASNACRSPSGTVQETGSERPPCGGIRSPMRVGSFRVENVERGNLGETGPGSNAGAVRNRPRGLV